MAELTSSAAAPAGHETTGHTMSALLRLLERHPRVLERLQQEQAQILAQHGPALTGMPCCLRPCHAWSTI